MNSRTKKIAFSSVSVLAILAMLVGITMAWFTDTEKTKANFNAGVLNIEVTPGQPDPVTKAMEFTNLRPMELDAFQAELGDNFGNVREEGFTPIPKYFHPVTVKNAGTLPAQIVLSMEDLGACSNKISNVVANSDGGVKQDGQINCDTAYTLKDVLQIFVYQKTTDSQGNVQWVKAKGVDLNPEKGSGSMQTYTIQNPLGAGESEDYVIAGYLPQTVGNDYQAKHFHANFVVMAGQADKGADIGSGQQPDPVEMFVTVNQVDVTDNNRIVGSQRVSMGTDDTTKQFTTNQFTAAAGFEFVENQGTQTVELKDGVVTPDTIAFEVKPTTEKTTLIRYLNVDGNNAEVGTYAYPLGVATNSVTSIEIAKLTPPTGFVLVEGQGTQTVTVTGGVVDPSEFNVNVKPEGITPPVDPDPDDPFPNGDGSEDNPFWITNQTEMSAVRNYMNKHFIVKNDFSITTSNWNPIGWTTGTADIKFTGSLNGDGYTISGMRSVFDFNTDAGVGLFAYNGGTIKNLTITNARVECAAVVGIVAAQNTGTIENCHVKGIVTGSYYLPSDLGTATFAGGITGVNAGRVIRSSADVSIVGFSAVGGLVGYNTNGGLVSECYAQGTVNGNYYGNPQMNMIQIGGLVGANTEGAVIEHSYSLCTRVVGYSSVGGFVGYNKATVRNSYVSDAAISYASTPVHECVGNINTSLSQVRNTYYESDGSTYDSRKGTAISTNRLKSATVPNGFDVSLWNCIQGQYPDLVNNPR